MKLTERARVGECTSARLLATFTKAPPVAPGQRRKLRRHIEGRPGIALCGAPLGSGGLLTGSDRGDPAEPCATCRARAPKLEQRAQRRARRSERKRLRELARVDHEVDAAADDAAWEWLDG